MEWLEAGLAFAVTMMVFSTIVSIIVETGHRFLRVREKGLKMIMTNIYEDIILPRLSVQLGDKKTSSDEFIEKMTRSRFLPGGKNLNKSDENWFKKKLFSLLNAEKLKSLTTLEFIERLPETPVGKSLMKESTRHGKKYIEIFLEDLASKYEDFGESATEYFKRRVKLVSVLVAIGLAFSLNINAIHLFKTFLGNKDIRQAIIEKGDNVAKKLKEQEKKLSELLETTDISQEENVKKINDNINDIQNSAELLSQTGIPVGWETAPWKSSEWKEKNAKGWVVKGTWGIWILLKWFIAVLLAGLLIGLGGPFWFDTFRKLLTLTSLIKGLQTTVQQAKESGVISEQEDEQKPDMKKSKFVKVFETASSAWELNETKGRLLLTPDGNIDKGGIL